MGPTGASCPHRQRSGAILGHPGANLGQLGPTWGQLGATWGHLGTNLGPTWGYLGRVAQKTMVFPSVFKVFGGFRRPRSAGVRLNLLVCRAPLPTDPPPRGAKSHSTHLQDALKERFPASGRPLVGRVRSPMIKFLIGILSRGALPGTLAYSAGTA